MVELGKKDYGLDIRQLACSHSGIRVVVAPAPKVLIFVSVALSWKIGAVTGHAMRRHRICFPHLRLRFSLNAWGIPVVIVNIRYLLSMY